MWILKETLLATISLAVLGQSQALSDEELQALLDSMNLDNDEVEVAVMEAEEETWAEEDDWMEEGEEGDEEMVESMYFNFIGNKFGTIDFLTGFAIGVYGPLQYRWRDGDCRSQFYKLASNLLGYSKHATKSFEANPVSYTFLGLQMVFTGFNIYNVYGTCWQQYDDIQNDPTPWTDSFSLLSNLTEVTPTVKGVDDRGAVAEVISVVAMLLAANGMNNSLASGYYHFSAGKSMGSLVGGLVTNLDYWLDLGLITPEYAWDRYTGMTNDPLA